MTTDSRSETKAADASTVTCNWNGETLKVGDTRCVNGEQYECWKTGQVGKNGKKC